MSGPAQTVLELGPERIRMEAEAAAELAGLLAGALGLEAGKGVPCTYPLRPISQLARAALEGQMDRALTAVHEAQSVALARPLRAGEILEIAVRVDATAQALTVRAEGRAEGGRVFEAETRLRLLAGSQAGLFAAAKGWQGREGDLPPLVSHPLDGSIVSAYARAAADPNPIHTDTAAAKAVGLDSPIVHGMLVAALAEPALGSLGLGDAVSTMRTRFLAPVPVGAAVTLHARPLGGRNFRVVACLPDGGMAALSDVAPFA